MNSIFLLFEVSDKVTDVASMYFSYFISGIIGLALGSFRWWLGLIWVFGTAVLVFGFFIADSDIYEAIIQELGYNYILHQCLSPLVSIILTAIGMEINRKKNVVSNLI